MKAKGITAVLNRDREKQDEIFKELNAPREDSDMAKNDMYKYFRVMDDQRTEGSDPKEKGESREAPPKKKDKPPKEQVSIDSEPSKSEAPSVYTKEIVETPVETIEDNKPEEVVSTEGDNVEEVLQEDAMAKIAEEARLAEEERREAKKKESESAVPLEAPKDIDKIEKPLMGKEITKEEADEIERFGEVLKKTIIITKKEEALPEETTKPEDEKPLILKIRKNGKEIELTEPVYIVGRLETCDIPLIGETYVGRRHAEIEVKGGVTTLRDLNSKNGTRINGKKIDKAAIERGDLITFADVECFII